MVYLQFGKLAAQMQSFSAWPASSNQDAHDLSDAGFFYTGEVLYKQKPPYYRNTYFVEKPANKNCFCYSRKVYTICFHCGIALKDGNVTYSAWQVHAIWSPKCLYALHIKTMHSYQSLLLEQSNVQRVWFWYSCSNFV